MLSTQSYQQSVPINVKRKRTWLQSKIIIGSPLHDFLSTRFAILNERGEFNILEIGCGEGNTTLELETTYSNASIVALDLNCYNRLTINTKAVYLEKDIQEFVLENSFDCAIGIAVLPYVRDKMLALLNIWRSLKLHGVAVLSVQPYYFGPYALEMFAHGDIKWDHDHQALVIYKTSLEPTSSILPCLNYKYLEYCQNTLLHSDLETLGQLSSSRTQNIWPRFLRYPIYKDPFSCKIIEQKPYDQGVVSLYVKKCTESQEGKADGIFHDKKLYPDIMVKYPDSHNRKVPHEAFVALRADKLSSKSLTAVDELRHQKDTYRKLLNEAKFKGPTPTCLDILKSCVMFWRCPPYQEMDTAEFATEQYLSSEGKRFV